jgi:hypothetical protein
MSGNGGGGKDPVSLKGLLMTLLIMGAMMLIMLMLIGGHGHSDHIGLIR